jgi:hypothetical protein
MFRFLQAEYIDSVHCDRSFDNIARTLTACMLLEGPA